MPRQPPQGPVSLPMTGEPAPHKTYSVIFFFLGVIFILILLFLVVFLVWKFFKPQQLKRLVSLARKMPPGSPDFFSGNLRTISYFSFHTLKKATNNFHPTNLLGRGGFGPGKLSDGRMVAVKQLAFNRSQQGETEFLSEVRMITSIQHKNLVRLLGCCSDGPQRVLVYEYLKNRSLDLIVYGIQLIVKFAWKLYERSTLINLVDPKMLAHGYVEKDVLKTILIALLCLQPQANLRPPMSEIVAMLTFKGEVSSTPTRPVFLERRRKNNHNFSWDTISEPFPTPLRTPESPSISHQTN
ncbi:hypothetical protein ACFE04_024771 [Oxalis oulophora]